MKRIPAFLICIILIFGTVPVLADNETVIYAQVEVDYEAGIVDLSGIVTEGGNYLSCYLLFPGKTIQDIPNDSPENRVISHIEQLKPDSDGCFSYQFKYSGEAGLYTLCLKSGTKYAECTVDTTKSTSISFPVAGLKTLDTEYGALSGKTVKEIFTEARAELPEEIPVVLPTVPVGYREVYVAADGSDESGDGSVENPYGSVEKAITENVTLSGVVIYLREGSYTCSQIGNIAEKVQNEKFPLYISAYPGETVSVAGGETIPYSAFSPVEDKNVLEKLSPLASKSIVCADLSELGISYDGTFSSQSRPVLYADDKQYEIARWPNGSETVMREYTGDDGENGVVDSGSITTGIGSSAGDIREVGKYGEAGFEFAVEKIRPFSWENTGNIWMYGSFYAEWNKNHVKVKSMNTERRSIRTENGISWGSMYDKGNTFYYYNVFEELDVPGEWFLDEANDMLYLYPASELEGKYVTLSTDSQTMLTVESCKNIVINGINFEKIKDSAIKILDSEGVVIQNCTIDGCGGNAVSVEGDSRYCGVTTSKLQNVKGNAVYMGMTKTVKSNFTPQRNFLQNSYVYNCKSVMSAGIGNIVSHNVVSNSVGSALYIMGAENIYEYNEILAAPRDISDAGAIYLGGSDITRRGNHIRYNYIHDSGKDSVINGVYLDNKASGNYVYGNIMDGARVFIHGGSENSIYNNIILNIANEQGIHDSLNFYRSQERWVLSALEYGGLTAYLKVGYPDLASDPWKSRYPALADENEKLIMRISEYNADKESFPSKINVNFYTGEIVEGEVSYDTENQWEYAYSPTYDGRFDSTDTVTDLDTYLRAPRNLHIENNLLINVPQNIFIYRLSKRTADMQNNYSLNASENPFAGGDYSSDAAYEAIKAYIPGFEQIDFEKTGVIVGENAWNEYMSLGTAKAISPADGLDNQLYNKDMNLIWSSVAGATKYTLEIASDEQFDEILVQENLEGMNYTIDAETAGLLDNTRYYWRVKCTSLSEDITGGETVSDTFTFVVKYYDDSPLSVYNKAGITALNKTEENGVVTLKYMPFNATNKNIDLVIYAASYDSEGKLMSFINVPQSLTANDFAKELSMNPDETAETVKFFCWSADGKFIPYSKVTKVEFE